MNKNQQPSFIYTLLKVSAWGLTDLECWCTKANNIIVEMIPTICNSQLPFYCCLRSRCSWLIISINYCYSSAFKDLLYWNHFSPSWKRDMKEYTAALRSSLLLKWQFFKLFILHSSDPQCGITNDDFIFSHEIYSSYSNVLRI